VDLSSAAVACGGPGNSHAQTLTAHLRRSAFPFLRVPGFPFTTICNKIEIAATIRKCSETGLLCPIRDFQPTFTHESIHVLLFVHQNIRAMKALKKLIVLAMGMGLIMSCEDYPKTDVITGEPFNASFTVCCTQPAGLRIEALVPDNNGHYLTGIGSEAGLGNFQVEMQLCNGANPADGPVCGDYYAIGVITTASGEELHFNVPKGRIPSLTGDQQAVLEESDDRLMFVGGTGRFVGANGNASINGHLMGIERPYQLEFTIRGQLITSAPY
jgi:hypothetical protein